MGRTKKITSLIMALAMIVSLFAYAPVSAQAAKKKAKGPYLAKTSAVIAVGKKTKLSVKKKPKGVKTTYRTSKKKIATVTKKGVVKAKKAGKATITVTLQKKGYKKNLKFKVTVKTADQIKADARNKKRATERAAEEKAAEDKAAAEQQEKTEINGLLAKTLDTTDTPYTRGEWVKAVADIAGINTDSTVAVNHYTDTASDATYGRIAEAAYSAGLLPDNVNDQTPARFRFNPAGPVTREYAAYTLVKALGFTDSAQATEISDATLLRYPNEDAIAVEQQLISLDNGAFNPDTTVTQTAGDAMLSLAGKITSKAEAGGKKVENVVNTTKVAAEASEMKNAGSKVTVDAAGTYTVVAKQNYITNGLKKGNIIYVTADTGKVPVKIATIQKNAKKKTITFTGTKATLDETVKTLEYNGTPKAAAGVVAPVQSSALNAITARVGADAAATAQNEYPVSATLSNGYNLTGTVKINTPSPAVNMDVDVASDKVNNLSVLWDNNLTFDGTITSAEGSTDQEGTATTTLVTIPLALGNTGLKIIFTLYVDVSATGASQIHYTAHYVEGFQVRNGSARVYHDFAPTPNGNDAISITGTAKAAVGMKVQMNYLDAEQIFNFDSKTLTDVDFNTTTHDDVTPALVCEDGIVYLQTDGVLTKDDSFVGNTLAASSQNTVDESSSPVKIRVHRENGTIVPECTYGSGTLHGLVLDSDDGKPIEGALVRIYRELSDDSTDNSLIESTTTDANGTYKSGKLDAASYTVEVYQDGYISSTNQKINVGRDEDVETEPIKMIKGDLSSDVVKTISGQIIDATEEGDNRIDGVTYTVRAGLNNSTRGLLSTGSAEGTYSIPLRTGTYTITFHKDGYIDATRNVTITASDEGLERDVALAKPQLVQADGLYRIILTWGQEPSDLDSHLVGPKGNGNKGYYHIYYARQRYNKNDSYEDDEENSDSTSGTVTELDRDDTSSYGPETTTLYENTAGDDGVLHYYVVDYSNGGGHGDSARNSDSRAMSLSDARVTIYKGSDVVKSYTIPYNRVGLYWHVFDMDKNGNITTFNTVNNTYGDNMGSLLNDTEVTDSSYEAMLNGTIYATDIARYIREDTTFEITKGKDTVLSYDAADNSQDNKGSDVRFKAVGTGEATISVKSGDGSEIGTVDVTVGQIEARDTDPKEISIGDYLESEDLFRYTTGDVKYVITTGKDTVVKYGSGYDDDEYSYGYREFKAVGVGDAVVSAEDKDGNVLASAKIRVLEKLIQMNSSIYASALFTNTDSDTVYSISSGEGTVVKFESEDVKSGYDARIIGIGEGNAEITATGSDGEVLGTAKLIVTANHCTSLSIDNSYYDDNDEEHPGFRLNGAGDYRWLGLGSFVTTSENEEYDISDKLNITSAAPSIVKVTYDEDEAEFKVEGVASGTATLTATCGNQSCTFTVVVKEVDADDE